MSVPDLYRTLWRYKFLILLLTAVLGGVVYFFAKRQAPVYTASSLVRVQQRIQNVGEAFGALQTGGRLARTYVTIVATSTVAERISHELDGRVPVQRIVGHISGSQIEDLDLLRIDATAATPEEAQLLANAAPVALRNFTKQTETGTFRERVITIQPAALPLAPTSPHVKLDVLLAVIVGLVFNAGLALILEALSDRIRGTDELELLTNKRVIAIVPIVDLAKPSKLPMPMSTGMGSQPTKRQS